MNPAQRVVEENEREDDNVWSKVVETYGKPDNQLPLLCISANAEQIQHPCRIADRILYVYPDCVNKTLSGWSAFHQAASWDLRFSNYHLPIKQKELVLWLLHHKADVNMVSNDEWTPLSCAIQAHNVPISKLLVLYGANAKCHLIRKKLNGPLWDDKVADVKSLYARVQQRIAGCRRCAAALLSAPVLARSRIPRGVMLLIVKPMWAQRRFREEWEQEK